MKKNIFYILLLITVVCLTTNCKKEQAEEINIPRINTGFCSQMNLVDTINNPDLINTQSRLFITNTNIYFKKALPDDSGFLDYLIIMDFEGNYDSICIRDDNGLIQDIDDIFVTKNENIYATNGKEVTKLDKFGNKISKFELHNFLELIGYSSSKFLINEDNNTFIYVCPNDTSIKSASLSSSHLVNSFPFVYDTIYGNENIIYITLKTDLSNSMYIKTNDAINIYDENGIYIRTQTLINDGYSHIWDTWHSGYIRTDNKYEKIIFKDINGNEKGTFLYNGWYGRMFASFDYSIEVSPNDSTIVVRNEGKLYIYKVSE